MRIVIGMMVMLRKMMMLINYPRALCRDLTSSLVFPQPDEVVRIVPTSTAIRWMC